jgi:hypothetical protein
MSLSKYLTVVAILATAAIASMARASTTDDTLDRWLDRSQSDPAIGVVWRDPIDPALRPKVLDTSRTAPPVDQVAYWGWRVWGPPYGYYGYYNYPPYSTYYGGPYDGGYRYYRAYPGNYYYGPRVGVRVYPYGRVLDGYWY